MSHRLSPDTPVRDVVAQADRRRRSRDAARARARLAPLAAGLVVAVALTGRIAGWPTSVSFVVLIVLALGLAAHTIVGRRARQTTDAIAARVDRDASLAGELRSAHWFETADAPDDWSKFHVDRATEHARAVDWSGLYPSSRPIRAWAATAVLVAGAIVLSVTLPGRDQRAAAASADLAAIADGLPPELRKKLEALLAAVEAGKLSAEEARGSLEDLKELLAKIDPALQKKLAELLKDRSIGAEGQKGQKMSPDDLSERADKSAAGMPEDVRWALEDLAARLANSNANRQTAEGNPAASSQTGEKGVGSAQAETSQASAAEASMQLVREAASDPGAAKMMMGGGGAMGGDSRAGAGGNKGAETGAAEALLVAQALRKELVEASADTRGENVPKEDIRRKTEQGKSTLGFTHVAPPAAFERSRADAPPPVPEARRPLLLHYFMRR